MIKVAARYGISGRGLAKACEKAGIPVPERGYWAKVQAGYKIAKAALPAARADTADRITIAPPGPRIERPAPPPPPPTVQAKMEAELRPEARVTVSTTLSSPHRIVAVWLEEDRRERERSRRDQWLARHYEPIDKTELARRRLRILSTLFKALEARKYKLLLEGPYQHQVLIALENEKLTIVLEERKRQVRRYLTEAEKAERRYLSTNQTWTQEKHPTGELVLKIKEAGGYGVSKEWCDAADDLIEDKLNVILGGIAAAFEEICLRREREAAERARQWKIEEQRQQREMERKRETIRYRRLLRSCEEGKRAADIRALVAAVEASPRAAQYPEIFADWKAWALQHADRIDPFNDPDLFDREVADLEVYALRD